MIRARVSVALPSHYTPTARRIRVLDDFSETSYYSAIVTQLNLGTAFTIASVFRTKGAGIASNNHIINRGQSTVGGFTCGIKPGVAAGIQVQADHTDAIIDANIAGSIVASKFFTVVMRRTPGFITMFLNGASVGSVAAVGAADYHDPHDLFIGQVAGLGANDIQIASTAVASTTAMLDADILKWHNQVKIRNKWSIPNADHVWYAGDAGATWRDRVSGLTLTKAGTPTVQVIDAIVFA